MFGKNSYLDLSGCLYLVHEGQSPDDHPHPAGPLGEAEDMAVCEDPQGQHSGILHFQTVLVHQEEGLLSCFIELFAQILICWWFSPSIVL